MRHLFGDVIGAGPIRVVVPAAEELSEDGVVRLLDSLWLDVPASEVVPQDRDEPLFRRGQVSGAINDVWRQPECQVDLDAEDRQAYPCKRSGCEWKSVTRSSIERGSRTKLRGFSVRDQSYARASRPSGPSVGHLSSSCGDDRPKNSHREGDPRELHARSELADHGENNCATKNVSTARSNHRSCSIEEFLGGLSDSRPPARSASVPSDPVRSRSGMAMSAVLRLKSANGWREAGSEMGWWIARTSALRSDPSSPPPSALSALLRLPRRAAQADRITA